MGKPGSEPVGRGRQTLETELGALQMPLNEEADLIGSIVLSVLRDFGVGGHYGKALFDSGEAMVMPTLATIYQPEYVNAVAVEMTSVAVVNSPEVLLYTGWGDMLGNLSRLLVIARETSALQPLLEAANAKIATLGLEAGYMRDDNFIRHLRNAIAHARFGVEVNQGDPFTSRIVFIDIDPRAREISARIKATGKQLSQVMRIVIHEVFERYLLQVGWQAKTSGEPTQHGDGAPGSATLLDSRDRCGSTHHASQ